MSLSCSKSVEPFLVCPSGLVEFESKELQSNTAL